MKRKEKIVTRYDIDLSSSGDYVETWWGSSTVISELFVVEFEESKQCAV
jgi:hypothetical protein